MLVNASGVTACRVRLGRVERTPILEARPAVPRDLPDGKRFDIG